MRVLSAGEAKSGEAVVKDLAANPANTLNDTASWSVDKNAIIGCCASPAVCKGQANGVASSGIRYVDVVVAVGVYDHVVEERKARFVSSCWIDVEAGRKVQEINATYNKRFAAVPVNAAASIADIWVVEDAVGDVPVITTVHVVQDKQAVLLSVANVRVGEPNFSSVVDFDSAELLLDEDILKPYFEALTQEDADTTCLLCGRVD